MSIEVNELCKKVVEAIFKDVRKDNVLCSECFMKDWSFSYEEWRLVQGVLKLIDQNNFSLSEIKAYLDSYFYIDSKTLRFIDEGYMVTVDNHQLNFSDVSDAIDCINSAGHKFKHWYEVEEESEMERLGRCYNWNNTTNGVSAAQASFDMQQKAEKIKAKMQLASCEHQAMKARYESKHPKQ